MTTASDVIQNVQTRSPGRWLLVVGGAFLGALGLKRRSLGGFTVASAGAAMIYCGLQGGERAPYAVSLRRSMTIRRPRREVYDFWLRLDDLPRCMEHVSDVTTIDERRSAWSAEVPGTDGRLEWIAEIVFTDENRRLSWKSLPGGDVFTEGEVQFEDAPDGESTQFTVHLDYRPPGGRAGRLASRVLNPAFERLVREDIRRVKQVLEAGEIPSIVGQPSGALVP